MVFVNSMSDLWHPLVPAEFIGRVFEVMARTRRHTYQVLTKRPENMRAWFAGPGSRWADEPLLNVWLGTSIENNRWVGRADELRATPATVRFISAEPLLGPLPSLVLTGIDWLIVGGESGSNHRPMDEAWVYELRAKADQAETAFFFKQWGGRTAKSGGRHLDGRTWDEYPSPRPQPAVK
jgi:protein gp37